MKTAITDRDIDAQLARLETLRALRAARQTQEEYLKTSANRREQYAQAVQLLNNVLHAMDTNAADAADLARAAGVRW